MGKVAKTIAQIHVHSTRPVLGYATFSALVAKDKTVKVARFTKNKTVEAVHAISEESRNIDHNRRVKKIAKEMANLQDKKTKVINAHVVLPSEQNVSA